MLELKWLGHASWMIKSEGKTIYIDPYEGDYEKGDVVLASHSHTDHCKQDKVKAAVGPTTTFIAPSDCSKVGLALKSLKPGEKLKIGEVEIEAVEAYNFKRFRSPGVPFHPKGFGVGYLIKTEGKTVYHTGDTDLIPEMKEIKNVDVMLVASGGTYTMDNDEAAEAVLLVKPKIAFPMHIWDTDPKILKEKVELNSSIKVILIKPGETYSI